ncbi:hypothetical protein K438DRAFT_1763239 [Mycena galopus ATCC 62051]|nr:hypothetical protein K438DRAFT_1763239 [Mycena galopus ATCC 62051]
MPRVHSRATAALIIRRPELNPNDPPDNAGLSDEAEEEDSHSSPLTLGIGERRVLPRRELTASGSGLVLVNTPVALKYSTFPRGIGNTIDPVQTKINPASKDGMSKSVLEGILEHYKLLEVVVTTSREIAPRESCGEWEMGAGGGEAYWAIGRRLAHWSINGVHSS